MKATRLLWIPKASKAHIDHLRSIVEAPLKVSLYPDGATGQLHAEIAEGDKDCEAFEHYCQGNGIWFSSVRHRIYSAVEIEAAEWFLMADTPVGSNTEDTQYNREEVCPKCGVGLKQDGPLILKLRRPTRRKMFWVSLRQSNEWVVAEDAAELLKPFSGFHLGAVWEPTDRGNVLMGLRQIIAEDRLPRMASSTNFSQYEPPLKNKCECNRAGWNLRGEVIYERSALARAKDVNLTLERWYGGGLAGLRWLIVSQRFRQVMVKNKLLKASCFDPVRIISQDPGNEYKFDLPLDLPS